MKDHQKECSEEVKNFCEEIPAALTNNSPD
jgi:hypothetical protein